MDTIIFKLIKFLSEMTLLIAKQSQYWCFEICNVIELWILWNYSYWCMFKAIGHNCINLRMGQNTTKYKMDQTCIISCDINHIDSPTARINILSTLSEGLMIEIQIVNYNQFDTNACAAMEFYQKADKMTDSYLTVDVISVIDTMKHVMEILIVLCAIIGKKKVFIVIYDVVQNALNKKVIVVFMITNYGGFDANVDEMMFYSSNTNTFNAIITKIKANGSITLQTQNLFVIYAIIDECIIIIDIISESTRRSNVKNLPLCLFHFCIDWITSCRQKIINQIAITSNN